jgi:hypothetical protein
MPVRMTSSSVFIIALILTPMYGDYHRLPHPLTQSLERKAQPMLPERKEDMRLFLLSGWPSMILSFQEGRVIWQEMQW